MERDLLYIGEMIERHGADIRQLATAITPEAAPTADEFDNYVGSLTEAVMGITSGLHAIACAVDRLADAVEGE